MHIAEGVLSPPVLGVGALLTAGGVTAGLRCMSQDDVARTGVMSSALFVASLIHVPIGPANAHLILNGLAGLLLGWAVFPAFLIALALQAVLFGFGGFTTLGVNTFTMAFPALCCHYLFGRMLRTDNPRRLFLAGFAAGASAIVLAALFLSLSLLATGREFSSIVMAVLAAHIPILIIEGFVTASVVTFLHKTRPQLLLSPRADGRIHA